MAYEQHLADESNSLGPPDFSRAVISMWFKAPAASFVAAKAQYDSAIEVFPNTDFRLIGVIPLLTFGPTVETATSFDGVGAATSVSAISPCVIGISCGLEVAPDFDVPKNVMYARLQYSAGGTTQSVSGNQFHDYFETGAAVGPFGNGSGTPIVVTADQWHHVLTSFDMSGGSGATLAVGPESSEFTISSSSSFYWSFDDVNHTSIFTGALPNKIISAATSNQPAYDAAIGGVGSYSYNFSANTLPTSPSPIGLPSTSGFSGKIYNVSIARFQMFTGVTLDTGVTDNRRAFVTAAGKPADPKLAAQLLGKSPLYRFDSSQDWIDGRNRGTGGSFSPVGSITKTTGP